DLSAVCIHPGGRAGSAPAGPFQPGAHGSWSPERKREERKRQRPLAAARPLIPGEPSSTDRREHRRPYGEVTVARLSDTEPEADIMDPKSTYREGEDKS